MLNEFFFDLKNAGLPVSIKEYLDLLNALQQRVIPPRFDELYYLARLTLVKNEAYFDRFDKTFARCFRDLKDSPEDRTRSHTRRLAESIYSWHKQCHHVPQP